ALTVLASYPGFMSFDPLEQLRQARAGQYGDWFPPSMALIWRYLDMILPGPGGMLLLQAAMLWAGLALIALHTASRRLAPALVLLLGFWPPIFAASGAVWKDLQMLGAFVLATGLLLSAQRRAGAWPLAGALLFLFYGCTLRHNAVLPALPLVAWAAVLVAQRLRVAGAARWGLAIALLGGLILGPKLFNHQLVNAPDPPVQQVLFAFDLYGASVLSGENLLPAYAYTKPLDVALMQELYPTLSNGAVGMHWGGIELKLLRDRALVDDMGARWLKAIVEHPAPYLRHRHQLFVSMLGLRPQAPSPFWRGEPAKHPEAMAIAREIGLDLKPSPIADRFTALLAPWSQSLVFRVWPYLLAQGLCLAFVLPGVWRRRPWAVLAAMLATSGLLTTLPLFFLAPADDIRYHYWGFMAAMLAVAFAVAHARGAAFGARR
ncbi:MAG: hypothetical protein ACLGIN_04395, partial [Candidatus Sericytochromatia bacterium]